VMPVLVRLCRAVVQPPSPVSLAVEPSLSLAGVVAFIRARPTCLSCPLGRRFVVPDLVSHVIPSCHRHEPQRASACAFVKVHLGP
jgi:hypothetical protein